MFVFSVPALPGAGHAAHHRDLLDGGRGHTRTESYRNSMKSFYNWQCLSFIFQAVNSLNSMINSLCIWLNNSMDLKCVFTNKSLNENMKRWKDGSEIFSRPKKIGLNMGIWDMSFLFLSDPFKVRHSSVFLITSSATRGEVCCNYLHWVHLSASSAVAAASVWAGCGCSYCRHSEITPSVYHHLTLNIISTWWKTLRKE